MSTVDFLNPKSNDQKNGTNGLFQEKEKTRVSLGSYLQMFVVLAFILFLIYLFFYFTKNRFSKKFMGINGIEVLAKSSLVPKQTLLLVRIGPRILALNATNDGNMRTLAEFSDQEEIDRLLSEINKSSRDSIFQSLLTRNKVLYDEESANEDKELNKIEKQTDKLQR
jgi:flagellar biogenesis protein FliO